MYILILFFVIYVSNHFFIKWVLRALGVIIDWLALNPSSLIKGFQVYSPAPPDHVRFFFKQRSRSSVPQVYGWNVSASIKYIL